MKVLNQKKLAIALVSFGAVPFVVLTLLMLVSEPPRFLPVEPSQALHAYAVIIASFVAGLHWGIHFCKRTRDSVYLYSSFIALMLWLSMWAMGTGTGLAIVLTGFILLWIEEYRLSVQRVTTAWFWHLRTGVTAVVCACLAIATVVA